MNGLQKSRSSSALAELPEEAPSGPLSPPSNLTWRRQRLLRIGAEDRDNNVNTSNEATPLTRPSVSRIPATSYGTLPARNLSKSSLRTRHGFPALQDLRIPGITSTPGSPLNLSPVSFRKSYFGKQRPISAYDANLVKSSRLSAEGDPDVQTNGIRVWYSSFTSIDWLHDAIKDSVRRLRLRKHKSLRGRIRRQIDRSIGWVIVTIVGILTAVAAFLIVRSEQWLFDFKDGVCKDAWWKAQRFCCPTLEGEGASRPSFVSHITTESSCSAWKSWAEIFGVAERDNSPLRQELVDYAAYACIAVSA